MAQITGRNPRRILPVLGVLLAASILISLALGRYPVSPGQAVGILLSRLFPMEPFWTERMETVFFNIRLPRILLGCLVGCALSAAGAVYQGVFQNPMASPDFLGASKGAAFGAALAILKGGSGQTVTLSAFCFGLGAVAVVWLIGERAGGKRVLSLVLAGMMISSLFDAGTSFLKLVADPSNQLPAITYWMMGSLASARGTELTFVLLPMAVGLTVLYLFRWKINLLTMGGDEAKALGLNVTVTRLAVMIAATLITAAAVSVSGFIGWIGLVVPHVARRLVGNDYRSLLPASMLTGGIFMLLVDNVSRNLLSTEIPLGILTALVGAPFFLWLILRGGGET